MALSKIKFISIITCALLVVSGIAYGAFVVSDGDTIQASGSINSSDVENTKHKVEFKSGDTVEKTMYVDSDYNLSLKDAPMYLDSNNNPIKWVCNYNGSSICLNDWEPENYQLPDSLTFTANSFTDAEKSNQYYINTANNVTNVQYIYKGNIISGSWEEVAGTQISSGNNIDIFSNDTPYVLDDDLILALSASWSENSKPTFPSEGKTYYKYGASYTTSKDPGIGNDITISLSNNQNIVTAKLSRDVIVTSNITIGGYTGFYGNNADYSQHDFAGFIVGEYCTLDLNGHDLVVVNQLDCWGEITDSQGTGTLVLMPNSTYWTVFEIEDTYHEKRMPYTYFSNDNIFSMYRCPYWTCTTRIYPGANVYGKYRIDLGGNNTNYIKGDIKLFGSTEDSASKCLFLIEDRSGENEGYILRSVTDRKEITEYADNLFGMVIKYKFYKLKVTFNKFVIRFYYNATLFSIEKDMDSSGYAFFISPYYNISFYSCDIYLNQHLVFMPGSYLFIDADSSLNMSYAQAQTMEGIDEGILFNRLTVPDKHWQSSAGLTFIDKMFFSDDIKSLLLSENTEGYACTVYQSTGFPEFWNKLEKARADIYGTITFSSQNYEQFAPIEFGGLINIFNLGSFQSNYYSAIQSGLDVRLYSSTFKSDWCRVLGDTITNTNIYRDITGYYNYPLVSNNYVLMDPITSQFNSSLVKYTYDFENKLIEGSNSKKYSFIFTTNDNNNMYLSNDINGYKSNASIKDSLDGSYKEVSYLNNKTVKLNNGDNYILYQGAYIKFDPSTKMCSLGKFLDNTVYASSLNKTMTFNANLQKWKAS